MSEQQPYLLAASPYDMLRDRTYDVAVLPWAATEAHNLHLPYGTDITETERIAAESARLAAAQGTRVIVLPLIPYGVNTGQLDIPLTINMNPSTQMAILRDVAASLEGYGIPKLAVLNGHGGNDFRQMIRELTPATRLFLCAVNWYQAVPRADMFERPGDHADEMETSLMLHLAPELVLPLERAGRGAERRSRIGAFREGWAWTPRRWTQVTRDTGVGDPSAATAEKGRRYFEAVTRKIAAFFTELAAVDPRDLYLPEP